jgi:hypothetical protein
LLTYFYFEVFYFKFAWPFWFFSSQNSTDIYRFHASQSGITDMLHSSKFSIGPGHVQILNTKIYIVTIVIYHSLTFGILLLASYTAIYTLCIKSGCFCVRSTFIFLLPQCYIVYIQLTTLCNHFCILNHHVTLIILNYTEVTHDVLCITYKKITTSMFLWRYVWNCQDTFLFWIVPIFLQQLFIKFEYVNIYQICCLQIISTK